MSDDKQPDALDPRERMRAALEAKKAASHDRGAHLDGKSKTNSGPQGQAGSKRVFRRKSGG